LAAASRSKKVGGGAAKDGGLGV